MTGHMLTYKGYAVYYENGLYWIGQNPTKKYFSFGDAKNVIDKLEDFTANN